MEKIQDILEEVLKMGECIASTRERVMAREKNNPESSISGWHNIRLTPIQLFIEYNVTNGIGYHDSFYWNIGMPSTGYQKVRTHFRSMEIEDSWRRAVDPSQIPFIPAIDSS